MTKKKGLCLPISGFSTLKEKNKQMVSPQNGDTRGGPPPPPPPPPLATPLVIIIIFLVFIDLIIINLAINRLLWIVSCLIQMKLWRFEISKLFDLQVSNCETKSGANNWWR